MVKVTSIYLRSLSSWITWQSRNAQFTLRDVNSTSKNSLNETEMKIWWDMILKLGLPITFSPAGPAGPDSPLGPDRPLGPSGPSSPRGPSKPSSPWDTNTNREYQNDYQSLPPCKEYKSEWTCRKFFRWQIIKFQKCSSPDLLWFPCHPWNLGNHPRPKWRHKEVANVQ